MNSFDLFIGMVTIAFAIYWGMVKIAEAIRSRELNIRFVEPLRVEHKGRDHGSSS